MPVVEEDLDDDQKLEKEKKRLDDQLEVVIVREYLYSETRGRRIRTEINGMFGI